MSSLLHKTLVGLFCVQSYTYICLYYKKSDSSIVIVGVYVDELLVTNTTSTLVDQFPQDTNVLEANDFGMVKKFQGMGVTDNNHNEYTLKQELYIEKFISQLKLS